MKTTRTYEQFFKYQEITDIIQGYERQYPDYVKVSSLNKTPEGRDIWLVTITNAKTGAACDKPGYYMDANIHAGEVTGNTCTMFFMDYVLSNFKDNAELSELLDKTAFYIIPRIAMDGSECYLTTPETMRSANRLYPYEELQAGVQPADIDGDGVIRKMRMKSPYGGWKVSDKDPRVMVRRRPDDKAGDFYHVFHEGMFEKWEEHDGTALFNAPAKWANDFNRNFPLAWGTEADQKGGGDYALSNVETRTLVEFLSKQRNICAGINFHTMGGVILYPPGFKHMGEAAKEDIARYKEIGKLGTEESGYPVINIRDEYLNPTGPATLGSFDDFNHYALGFMNYTIECWDLDARVGLPPNTPKDKTDDDRVEKHLKYLAWIDENLGGEGVKPWTAFNHPQLGKVEIGGIDNKAVVQNCPPKYLLQEAEKHTRFILRYAKALPNIVFTKAAAEKIDGETYKVTVQVANTGYLPSYITKEALRLKIQNELTVSLSGQAAIVDGAACQNIGNLEGYSGILPVGYGFDPITEYANPCEKQASWIVKAKAGTTLTVACKGLKTGLHTTQITL